MKKWNLIIPMMGRGKRMLDGGHSLPKPMIMAGDKTILEWGMASIDTSECDITFVVRQEHILHYSIDSFLKTKFGDDITILPLSVETEGSADTCWLACPHLKDIDKPLIVFCPDVSFSPIFKPDDRHFAHGGAILTFKANSNNYSYVSTDKDGFVDNVVEKSIISENASVGIYCFESARLFMDLVKEAISNRAKHGNEYYIAPLYNFLRKHGKNAITQPVEDMYIMGTPEELDFFKNIVLDYFRPRSFILCSDHSGFDLKEIIRKRLIERQIAYIDCGCYSGKDCDYTDFISSAVETTKHVPGGLILGTCRSGQGINITANKYKSTRSVLVSTAEAASLGIRHNAANFFAIPAGTFPAGDTDRLIDVLMSTQFQGGRHQNRISKMLKI